LDNSSHNQVVRLTLDSYIPFVITGAPIVESVEHKAIHYRYIWRSNFYSHASLYSRGSQSREILPWRFQGFRGNLDHLLADSNRWNNDFSRFSWSSSNDCL